MPTPAQEAFAEGFSDLLEIHGETWTFGASEFAGVASILKADDPRLLGSTDRHIEIQVSTAGLPAVRPKRSDEIVRDGVCYRITRGLDVDLATGLTTILAVYAGERPAIATQPLTQTFTDGQASLTLTVVASGVPAPTYQWKKDGVAISGATSASLALSTLGASDAGSYTVVVTNSFQSVTSAAAVLTLAA
jgi:hypothetical protein